MLQAFSSPVAPEWCIAVVFEQVVAKLVRVKEPASATALEVAAGGRLYQVSTQLLTNWMQTNARADAPAWLLHSNAFHTIAVFACRVCTY